MALTVALVLWLAPPPATVEVESLAFDPANLAKKERVEVKVTEEGKATVYAGVPLAALIEDRLKVKPGMPGLRALADVVLLVRADDGYQAAVSAAAVAMDPKGERYLLALARDGEPLGEKQGPVKLVIPGDPQRVRWVRMVTAVDLVRLPKAPAKGATPRSR